MKIFGFTIGRDITKVQPPSQEALGLPTEALDDGAVTIQSNAHYGTYVDLEGSVRNEIELISRYREMANHPELEMAINEIINEAITRDQFGKVVDINLDKLDQPETIKKKIADEFSNIQKLLNFKNLADDLFKRWYIDGRIFYQAIVDKESPRSGIAELRYIDPRKIRKVREVLRDKDPKTGAMIIKSISEYYVYNDRGTTTQHHTANVNTGIKISPDSIINVNSGLMDAKNTFVISYLHSCIKPLNQLRMIEDAVVIYRLCLVGDTRIKTVDGWKYIKDITENDIVYSFYGRDIGLQPTKVKKQWKTGTKQTFKVNSKHFEVVGSDNHPILVLDKQTNVVEYVDIKDIQPKRHCFVYHKPEDKSEYISFPKIRNKSVKIQNPDIWVNLDIPNKEKYISTLADVYKLKRSSVRNFLYGTQYLNKDDAIELLEEIGIEVELTEKYEFLNENVDINLPEYIDEEFARLFGFMIGDGSVNNNGLVFAEGIDDAQNLYYAGLLTKYFGNCKKYKTKRNYGNYTTSSTLGAELFKSLGFITGAKNKRIPNWVYDCPDSIKKQFILGLCDADGHNKDSVYTGTWSSEIELSNKKLIEDIKELWTSLGLTSGKINYRKRSSNERIIGDENSPRVMPEVESWYVRISDYELPQFENILNVIEAEVEDVYELEVESEKHNFIANGVVVHNSRAPERRIFYIDVGNLPKGKAEQYLRDIMVKYRNKMVYDAETGQLRDDRKHMSMLEDFWLPRREGGKGTEITTLPAGQNLGEMEDVKYFRNKLLNALNVPISRLEPQDGGMIGIGRSTEVTRDEVKFSKFIQRLRLKFSRLFDDALALQLTLKGVCSREEWEEFKEDIFYDYVKDNNFTELKDSELLRERLTSLGMIDPYIGKYFSAAWVRRNILKQTEEDIEKEDLKMAEEQEAGITSLTQDQQDKENQDVDPDQYPPEDNVSESDNHESHTPMLDQQIDKYKNILNKK